MFSRIVARHYRSLQGIDQTLKPFQALVGPNASGKTTFLDTIGLLSDLMRNRGDVCETVHARSANFEKLVWLGRGHHFQLAVEAPLPDDVVSKLVADQQHLCVARYEVEIGIDETTNEIGLNHETLWLRTPQPVDEAQQRELFPAARTLESSILSRPRPGFKVAIKKNPGGNDNYYPEGGKSYAPSFKLGRTKSALAHMPADEDNFPASSWFRRMLENGVQNVVLNSQIIRQPSPPGLGKHFKTDGSNLPWVIAELRKDRDRFALWLDHVQTALEDITDIDTVERAEDRHRYLVIEYANGARVPSWLVSDGTLRLLALTIPAYVRNLEGILLIEEPENGIHPRAIETIVQSLSSISATQVLMATHSPVALNMLEPGQILCFAKDPQGATDIISGEHHPALREWHAGHPDLGLLFASGILS